MDNIRQSSAMQSFLKMLNLSKTPTVPMSEDEITTEVDEPPDDQLSELNPSFHHKDPNYTKSPALPKYTRRESLLTRAILAGSRSTDVSSTSADLPHVPRGLSTASSHSFASTAELTSDGDMTSPTRSASPSPPPPANHLHIVTSKPLDSTTNVVIAPVTKDDKPQVVQVGEAAVEKTLGRKRCIMFACADRSTNASKETSPVPVAKPQAAPEPAPRKCRLTFACSTRQDSSSDAGLNAQERRPESHRGRLLSPAPVPRRQSATKDKKNVPAPLDIKVEKPSTPSSQQQVFHEFASSQDETDAWVHKASELDRPKLTIDDCLKKENVIRRIGKEAEEEAEEEEREQEELENELEEDNDVEDDFAPSDEDEAASDGGNESDDEGGFADSDDESDAGSDYRFWAPATSTAPTSADNLTHFSSRQRSRSRASSIDSTQSESAPMAPLGRPMLGKRRPSKLARMRPGTPELPDSTDFVCGTLDEDRPLEAAYISCREQKKREKHVPIPQDIDPSFPTTDPEDEVDEDEEEDGMAESSDHMWMKDQFTGFDEDGRGRRRPSAIRVSPLHSPPPVIAPLRQAVRPQPVKRGTNRSPPPPKHNVARSPAPRRLFGHSPTRLRSPPPARKLRSPRGSPTNIQFPHLGITINRLAQRPTTDRTFSLPHTPNPFFRNWRNGSPPVSCIPSAAVSPGGEDESVRTDLHVRGPVDIVIGLEKKRQKRKEKFWRQHCRKVAKEHAEKKTKTIPGRGAERMKELGLECAERTRGYNLGQQAQLVISL